MDFIRTLTTETTHALEERLEQTGKYPRGKTWCGKTVTGRTGGCIAPLIDCGSCVRVMRKAGWQV